VQGASFFEHGPRLIDGRSGTSVLHQLGEVKGRRMATHETTATSADLPATDADWGATSAHRRAWILGKKERKRRVELSLPPSGRAV
jgi:hypothetical protein